jgi:Flp pilus assembly protein TadG
MRSIHPSLLSSGIKDQSGQALPWMVFLMILFCGAAGITVDLGRAYICYRELQASTDAAAMSASYQLSQPNATETSIKAAASNYSSVAGAVNINSNLPAPSINTTLNCSTSVANLGILCSSTSTGYNVVRVTQSVTIPTYFIRVLSLMGVDSAKSIGLTAVSTAAARGATNSQYNVAIVIDTTASMNTQDSDAACGNTRIYCALEGVRTLLSSLSPCTPSGSGTNCNGGAAFDGVSLFTFPNIQANQASSDTTCPTSNPAIPSYSTPVPGATWSAPTGSNPTYQITSYLSDWSSTGKQNGSLNTSSSLAIASGGSTNSNCKGLQAPGGDGTYYAGAIYAAQSSLMAAQAANPGSQNALIILSDGDAQSTKINVTGTVQQAGTGTPARTVAYPSSTNQCQQAIDAANFATSQGTTVYTIAYGAGNSGCAKDTSGPLAGLSPCTALQKMASAPGNFYSDADASQNKGQCSSTSNPNLSLNQIFKSISTGLTYSRLVPNSFYN